ncbi:MAG: efflux RND transporter periplasmic adaptor subunit [Ignavibacteriae bacterium]|nr:MAG: efflux RND transporter periplasmic adaptor subunit [Ignavibacteriota bacterium]
MNNIRVTVSGRKSFISAMAAAGVVLGAAGCSSNPQAGGGKFSMPPTPIEVTHALKQKVEDKFGVIGSIEAIEAITVVSEIDGTIIRIPFTEGGVIRKGELIAQLDDAQLAAELKRAEALMEQSKTHFDRVQVIVNQKAGAPQDLDDAAADLKVAEANLSLAKSRFAKTRITAPFDGTIGARKVSVGTFVRSGMPITELANIDEIRVNFSAPEKYLPLLNRGASVLVSTIAYPGIALPGRIIAVEPVLDPGTRSARVVARVSNPGRKFHPGMSASVSVVLNERPDAVTVPNEAVFANGDQSFVYVVKSDSTAARVPVTLGTRMTDVVEIVQGLTPGTEVVKAGYQKLFEGARVMPISSPAKSMD